MTTYKNDKNEIVEPDFVGDDGQAYKWKAHAPASLIAWHGSIDLDYSAWESMEVAIEEAASEFDLCDDAIMEEMGIPEEDWEDMDEDERSDAAMSAKRQQVESALIEYSREEVAELAQTNHSIKWAYDYLDLLAEVE